MSQLSLAHSTVTIPLLRASAECGIKCCPLTFKLCQKPAPHAHVHRPYCGYTTLDRARVWGRPWWDGIPVVWLLLLSGQPWPHCCLPLLPQLERVFPFTFIALLRSLLVLEHLRTRCCCTHVVGETNTALSLTGPLLPLRCSFPHFLQSSSAGLLSTST